MQGNCQMRRSSSRDYRVEEDEDGLATQSGGESMSYIPEMRDNECQTRESLFYNTSSSMSGDFTAMKNASISPSPPLPDIYTVRGDISSALPSVNIPPPVGFTTFGYKNNQKPDKPIKKGNRFRAEAVIEMDRFKSPKRDAPKVTDPRQNRPYSVQSTKSAPDVIVTH